MLEQYLISILTSKFGHLISNLDPEKARISAWNGEVSFEDLLLRPEALQDIVGDECPIQIVYGSIGLLQVNISWKKNGCQVVLKDLQIIVTPTSNNSKKNVNKTSSLQKLKEKEVQLYLKKYFQANMEAPSSSWKSWLKQKSSTIFENLTIQVEGVHVRYEDHGYRRCDTTNRKNRVERFAIGISLNFFCVKTTEDGVEAELSPQENEGKVGVDYSLKHKVAEVQELAVYWDSGAKIMLSSSTKQKNQKCEEKNNDYYSTMFSLLEKADYGQFQHNYIVLPMSLSAHFTLTTPINNNIPMPPSQAYIKIPTVEVSISQRILEDIAFLRRAYTFVSKTSIPESTLVRIAGMRPSVRPKENSRLWWRYGMEAMRILLQTGALGYRPRSRRGWRGLVRILNYRKKYMLLYQHVLEQEISFSEELYELEEELEAEEIAAFRAAVIVAKNYNPEDKESSDSSCQIAQEYAKRAYVLQEIASRISKEDTTPLPLQSIQWEFILTCPDLKLVAVDTHLKKHHPIVQLTSASFQKLILMTDGSWSADCVLGSLEIMDMMNTRASSRFPRLLFGKECKTDSVSFSCWVQGGEILWKDVRYSHSASIFIKREIVENQVHVRVRLSPLETVYSTEVVEVTTRFISAADTQEFASDYNRLASSLSHLIARQKVRLRKALVEKREICIDLDVAAPTLVIPEDVYDSTCPMLVIDLGRLTFRNANRQESSPMKTHRKFDSWKLLISEVAVFSSIPTHQVSLVEPFSLDFTIKALVTNEVSDVRVKAVLPRLAFHLTSAAVRLVSRLQLRYKRSRESHTVQKDTPLEQLPEEDSSIMEIGEENQKTVSLTDVNFEFQFSAPFIAIRLENDVDGRDCVSAHETTPLLRISLLKTKGTFQFSSRKGTTFSASLHSLQAIDFYQTAGYDYCYLLSSIHPDHAMLQQAPLDFSVDSDIYYEEEETTTADLVKVEYWKPEGEEGSFLSLQFHELYMEWNPETLAAVQKAMRLPLTERLDADMDYPLEESAIDVEELEEKVLEVEEDNLDDFDDFFDARDDDDDDDADTSTIHSDTEEFFDAISLNVDMLVSPHPPQNVRKQLDVVSCPPTTGFFEVTFCLEKLRMNFNKDSRHRRLFSAQMDKSNIKYLKKAKMPNCNGGLGGLKVIADMGNLTFTDNSTEGGTLYQEIIGLKVDSDSSATSLFQLEFESFPRGNYDTSSDEEDEHTICINEESGIMTGGTSFLKLHFSPMRFVYLQQLWLEIMDYLYEGILGYAVWGSKKPQITQEQLLEMRDKGNPDMTFFRFEIVMDTPILVLPVSYRSPQYIRLKLRQLKFKNHFTGHLNSRGGEESSLGESCSGMQWYNNCCVSTEGLRIFSWCGKLLSIALNRSNGSDIDSADSKYQGILLNFHIQWPSSPTASLVLPKWRVKLLIGDICLSLQKEDYALLINFLYNNVMEPTRHLSEWEQLQKKRQDGHCDDPLLVSFLYDQKDAPPTTYHILIHLCSIVLLLSEDGKGIAEIQCKNVFYILKKFTDAISRQFLTCGSIILSDDSRKEDYSGFKDLLLPIPERTVQSTQEEVKYEDQNISICEDEMFSGSHIYDEWTYDFFRESKVKFGRQADKMPQLIYKSSAQLCGDNVKTLVINDTCIYFLYSAWEGTKSFFTNLPDPNLMSVFEVKHSIQIGERWYQIGVTNEDSQCIDKSKIEEEDKIDLDLLKSSTSSPKVSDVPRKQFRLLLNAPRIVLVTDSSHEACRGITLRLEHLEVFNEVIPNDTNITNFFIHELEIFTGIAKNPRRCNTNHSLLCPLNICGMYQKERSEKVMVVQSEIIQARAAYSDMSLAIDMGMELLSEIRATTKSATTKDIKSNAAEELDGTVVDEGNGKSQDISIKDDELVRKSYVIGCDGVSLLIIDDSLRHFAKAQELVEISLGCVQYSLNSNLGSNDEMNDCGLSAQSFFVSSEGKDFLNKSDKCFSGKAVNSTSLRLNCLNVIDHLQSRDSPYRTTASSNEQYSSLGNSHDKLGMNAKTFLNWENYCVRENEIWGYEVSSSIMHLMEGHGMKFRQPYNKDLYVQEERRQSSQSLHPDMIELNHVMIEGLQELFDIRFRSLTIQWNPSTVIALQRFLGRLVKVAKLNIDSMKQEERELLIPKSDSALKGNDCKISEKKSCPLQVFIKVQQFSVFLNKEHQNRRLLHMTIYDTTIGFSRDEKDQLNVTGAVGDMYACDPSGAKNEVVLSVLQETANTESTHRLLSFNFQTYAPGDIQRGSGERWVEELEGDVDDFFSLHVRTIRFIYLRDRTAELVDYLSNGLPGKGMGATKRAAKGFLGKRIQTRSAMSILVDAPMIFIPRHRYTDVGINIRLGDVEFKSWFEEKSLKNSTSESFLIKTNTKETKSKAYDTQTKIVHKNDQKDWWRCLSLSILNMGHNSLSKEKFDLHLSLRKPLWYNKTIIVRGRLSYVDTILKYQDWVLLRAIIQDNIGKPVDESKWDNIEKIAATNEDLTVDFAFTTNETELTYAEGARFIRYGGRSKTETTFSDSQDEYVSLDFFMELDGLCLTLTRDDLPLITSNSKNHNYDYDLLRLRVKRVTMGAKVNSTGNRSAFVKWFKMDLTDLGESGRLARSIAFATDVVYKKLAFSTIVEGYGPIDDGTNAPQLVLTLDMPSNDTPIVKIVLNYLSVNMLLKPLIELIQFVKCAWPLPNIDSTSSHHEEFNSSYVSSENHQTQNIPSADKNNTDHHPQSSKDESITSGFRIRLIANYPRIFLLADDCDAETRALVLRGLAVVNVSYQKEAISTSLGFEKDNENKISDDDFDTSVTISVDANLNSMETYINPNVQNAIGPNRHREYFKGMNDSKLFSSGTFEQSEAEQLHKLNSVNDDDILKKSAASELELGIALIEPVTAFLKFCQVQREFHPTLRNISFRMEPVSTMLSFEDLDLIETVLRRWTLEQSKFIKDNEQLESSEFSMNYSSTSPVKTSSTLGSEKLFATSEQGNNKLNDEVPANLNLFSSGSNSSFLEYEIVFDSPKLGLVLRKSGECFVVDNVQVSKYTSQISVGDKLISVNGDPVSRLPFKTVINRLVDLPRPIKVTFQSKYLKDENHQSHSELTFLSRANDVANDICSASSQRCLSEANSNISLHERSSLFSKNAFTLKFCAGQSNGLRIEKGYCGDMSVVTGLCRHDIVSSVAEGTKKRGQFSLYDFPDKNTYKNDESDNYIESDVMLVRNFAAENHSNQEGLEMELVNCSKNNIRLPRPGAVVLAVNDCPVTTLGHTKTVKLIQSLETSDQLPELSTQTNKDTLSKGDYYTMTFFEASASEWASVDTIVISISSVKLTLIDDINGRDMPLVRGNLDNISINFKRGFNLKTQSIDLEPPLILTLPRASHDHSNCNINLSFHKSMRLPKSDLSELIVKLKLEVRAGLEYYNARIAFWEPLLEPSHLTMKLEWQKGNPRLNRPGNLAFILSDGASSDSSMDNSGSDSSLICINITDAAMDMLIKTFFEWSEWRKSYSTNNDADLLKFKQDVETITHPDRSTECGNSTNMINTQSSSLLSSNIEHNRMHFHPHSSTTKDETVCGKTFSFDDNNEMDNVATYQNDTNSTPKRSCTTNMNRRSAARTAAAAALEFAQKRGAGKQKKGNVAKPFLLRNRTGVSIAFVQKSSAANTADVSPNHQLPENRYENQNSPFSKYNIKGFDSSQLKEVLDGCESRFNIELLSEDHSSSHDKHNRHEEADKSASISLTNGGARVRTYDGQYPHLCIAFDSTRGIIDLLDDLSVVKNGQTVRTLRVLHHKNQELNTFCDEKTEDCQDSAYSVLDVVWTVELENNRRILTLSGAISVASIGCGISIDVGVRIGADDQDVKSSDNNQILDSKSSINNLDIVKIGVAIPSAPFFLPLWLGLNGNVSVHVRPSCGPWIESTTNNDSGNSATSERHSHSVFKSVQTSMDSAEQCIYQWSTDTILECVLEYDEAPEEEIHLRPKQSSSNVDVYDLFLGKDKIESFKHSHLVLKWRQTCGNNAESNFGKVCCLSKSIEDGLLPAWLSCIGNKESSIAAVAETYSEEHGHKINKAKTKEEKKHKNSNAFVNISVGSTLTLRNLLPEDIEWEVICSGSGSPASDHSIILDGSSVRKGRRLQQKNDNCKEETFFDDRSSFCKVDSKILDDDSHCSRLKSGSGIEVFACDVSNMKVYARFKYSSSIGNWSEWAYLKLPDEFQSTKNPKSKSVRESDNNLFCDASQGIHLHGHQITVQAKTDLGIPLTMGVKMFPKYSSLHNSYESRNLGLDIVIHAELWLQNLTNIPDLVFGCPSSQVFENDEIDQSDFDAGLIAETALIEIASVLELGDKGKNLRYSDNDMLYKSGATHILPYQMSNYFYDEIFEYVEVKDSIVVRRWWTTEKNDSRKLNITDSFLPHNHKDDSSNGRWMIDCSGQVKSSIGGWESCRNLLGSKEPAFNIRRKFDHRHSFRRRRWFRKVKNVTEHDHIEFHTKTDSTVNKFFLSVKSDAVMFHQPVSNPAPPLGDIAQALSFLSNNISEFQKGESVDENKKSISLHASPIFGDGTIRILIKCGDGAWSEPIVIPSSGGANGVFRVFASRWPQVKEEDFTTPANKGQPSQKVNEEGILSPMNAFCEVDMEIKPSFCDQIFPDIQHCVSSEECNREDYFESVQPEFANACLSPNVYDLCYHISILDGTWGEFSRMLCIAPRFLIRNDSKTFGFGLKQTGSMDNTMLRVGVGEVVPFFWTDHRLPELVCIKPLQEEDSEDCFYKWSGGFDICNLGMVALRIRLKNTISDPNLQSNIKISKRFRTVRAHVEIRKGTGGTGITISLRDEDPSGVGSLFRIENRCPFPLWIAQDGMMANPMSNGAEAFSASMINSGLCSGLANCTQSGHSDVMSGDLVRPMESIAFGLDVPFRQGKYSHRNPASIEELLLLRVALAPLCSREGIETMKVISFNTVGDIIRLRPSNLSPCFEDSIAAELFGVRVLGTVCADGPTRVVRFWEMTARGSALLFHAKQGVAYIEKMTDSATPFSLFEDSMPFSSPLPQEVRKEILESAIESISLLKSGCLPIEEDARRHSLNGKGIFGADESESESHNSRLVIDLVRKHFSPNSFGEANMDPQDCDQFFTLRASFRGFIISFVDAVPSEIAVVSFRRVDTLVKWNSLRTNEASAVVSIGWLQVDNHCPSAPYPVAVRHVQHVDKSLSPKAKEENTESPSITVAITFAPKHNSGILCLKSITIAPRDLSISIDLAFIVRIQRFLLSIQDHLERSKIDGSGNNLDVNHENEELEYYAVPEVHKLLQDPACTVSAETKNENLYFDILTVLPFNLSLSVAPARALTNAQAALEGHEAAAVHAAVRKGDLLIGDGVGVLDVKLGSKNRTPLAVIRGVFKSILVDALLRCDAAALDFPGLALRNQITSASQLSTYLSTHYSVALRNNVPALLGSLAAFGNPIGLMKVLGDGMSDFISEPVKGLRKSVEELNPSLFVDGVARGTGSLARHTVGGFADSASLLTETLSKNMAVLTLDRTYAQKRDRGITGRDYEGGATTFVDGVGSGGVKLLRGVVDGVTGVIRAPIRGAEKNGLQGFAKGVGKGLLGLVVKPVIGLTDAATEVMIGVKGSVDGGTISSMRRNQIRPRRALYGRERSIRAYSLADATASSLMMRSRLAGDLYLSHCDIGNRVALLSAKRLLILGEDGQERIMIKLKLIKRVEVRQVPKRDGGKEWGVLLYLLTQRKRGEVEVISCDSEATAIELCSKLKRAVNVATSFS